MASKSLRKSGMLSAQSIYLSNQSMYCSGVAPCGNFGTAITGRLIFSRKVDGWAGAGANGVSGSEF